MVTSLLFCYDLFLYSVDFIILLNFMDAQYGNIDLSRFRKNLLLVFISLISGILLWNSPFGGTYPFFSVIFSIVFLPFYHNSRQKKILFSSILFVIACYLVLFVIAVVRSSGVNLRYIGINYLVMLGTMHLCFWLLIFLLRKLGREESILLPNKLLLIVLAIPCASFVVLVFFLIRINNNASTLFSLEFPLILVFILINIVTAFIYSQFCDLLKKTTEVLLLKQQICLSEQYFQDLTEAQDKIRGIRHDMKNHLQSLMFMSRQITPPANEFQEYIQKLLSTIHDASQIVSTGNMGIDAILSLKITQMNEMQIPIDSQIIIPAGIHLSIDDSTIIFGNILDNAIKACKENPPEKKWIRLEVRYIPRSLFIRITNPLPVKIFKTSLSDHREHGFGFKNVRTAIKNYSGTMDIENSNEEFCLKIILYNLG